jgi:glyoxylase-like metal-dependent hydrolase (beta-lactamase superfamily II)
MAEMSRLLSAIHGNSQRLDGGAMFGNAPRALWQTWIGPDSENRIPLACRCMLIEEQGTHPRRILFETGIGTFFEPKLRVRFGVEGSSNALLGGLRELGLSDSDIDVVVLSHLHFDHAGGLLSGFEEGPLRLLFPRATFIVGSSAWQRANQPHARDRASFIPELQGLLERSGRLEVVEGHHSEALGANYRLHRSDGHTPGLIAAEVASEQGPIVFATDLIPGAPWVHLPITMGYDRAPELLIEEKAALLSGLLERRGRLFFTHDPSVAMGRLSRSSSGRFGVDETWAHPQRLPI